MPSKDQVVAMLEPEQMDRLDVLRIVDSVSRSEALRRVVAAGLPALEAERADRIARLGKYASKQKLTMRQVAVMYANTFSRVTYGATLEELESGEKTLQPALQ